MEKKTRDSRDEAPARVAGANPEAGPGPSLDGDPSAAELEKDQPALETPPGGSGPDGIAGVIAGTIAAVAGRIARAMSHEPLANLYELHPEARESSPRELGFRFVPLDEIRGTAVAGIAQRGLDFTPLPAFKGENWQARWQRIQAANASLKPLPPVDLIKFGGEFWVLDGHNRVAAALADHAVGLDAMVTELVPLDGHSSEWATALLPHLGAMGELRAAASGLPPAMGVRASEQESRVETILPEPELVEADDDADPDRRGSAA